jgi:hypothetical protein
MFAGCIPPEAADTRFGKALSDSGGYERSALGCLRDGGVRVPRGFITPAGSPPWSMSTERYQGSGGEYCV